MQCQCPGCQYEGTEEHHIIFKSETRKTCILEWVVHLCAFHHKLGACSPHKSRAWRQYYYRYLPKDWAEQIEKCKTIRDINHTTYDKPKHRKRNTRRR